MVRPKAKELTSRELAVMQVFWSESEATAEDARGYLLSQGDKIAYVTVANVVRGLVDKGFLKQVNQERPFRYRSNRSFDDVSKTLVGDMIKRLFSGSREAMLVHLLGQKKLTKKEREYLREILDQQDGQS